MPNVFFDKEDWLPITVYSVVLLKSAEVLGGQAYSLNLAMEVDLGWEKAVNTDFFNMCFLRLLGILGES